MRIARRRSLVTISFTITVVLLTIACFANGAKAASEPPQISEVTTFPPVTHTSTQLRIAFNSTGTESSSWFVEVSAELAALEKGRNTTNGRGEGREVCSGELVGNLSFVNRYCSASELEPEVVYYARVYAKNNRGTAVEKTITFESVPLRPITSCCIVNNITESSVSITETIDPDGFETKWKIFYAEETPNKLLGPWTEALGASGVIPQSEADLLFHKITANITGLRFPDRHYFVRLFAENSPEWPPGSGIVKHFEILSNIFSFETAGPPAAETLPFHALVGEGAWVFGNVNPHGRATFCSVEFVDATTSGLRPGLERTPGASVTPEVPCASYFGHALPGVVDGHEYEFRVVASNESETTKERRFAFGGVESLKVPMAASGGAQTCSNEGLRDGSSGLLPDCRAYEQVTPVEKGAAMDIFPYHRLIGDAALVGKDGEHVVYNGGNTKWEPSPDAEESYYAFSRGSAGWRTQSLTPQPEAGVSFYKPTLFGANLTEVGIVSSLQGRPTEEFDVGRPGGPYEKVTTAPNETTRWAGASGDFSKPVLQTLDRQLGGHPTGTISGTDLYEWSGGKLSQVNVLSSGATVGRCGATLVGFNGLDFTHAPTLSFGDALSGDGSRIFFYARPGVNCSEPVHLYMRAGGETTDVGVYGFVTDSGPGSTVLLEHEENCSLYDSQAHSVAPLASCDEGYERIGSVPQRFTYADGSQFAFGGGGVSLLALPGKPEGASLPVPGAGSQIWRYDRTENTIECLSCASPFDPEPKLRAQFVQDAFTIEHTVNGVPQPTTVSANGDYVFFETASALVPEDVNGEIPATLIERYYNSSPSVDVYEWRGNGVNGCGRITGCVTLISNGIDGNHNVLLGTTRSGGDVFFATHSQLVGQDRDRSGDIYDARIGGGFPGPPVEPVECEGNSCQTPMTAPIDTTPASFGFFGPGNPVVTTAKPKAKPKKTKGPRSCRKVRGRHKPRCARGVKGARSGRRGRRARRPGGSG